MVGNAQDWDPHDASLTDTALSRGGGCRSALVSLCAACLLWFLWDPVPAAASTAGTHPPASSLYCEVAIRTKCTVLFIEHKGWRAWLLQCHGLLHLGFSPFSFLLSISMVLLSPPKHPFLLIFFRCVFPLLSPLFLIFSSLAHVLVRVENCSVAKAVS